eukprot:9631600-Lingulodinium_polyedra.AAC.1
MHCVHAVAHCARPESRRRLQEAGRGSQTHSTTSTVYMRTIFAGNAPDLELAVWPLCAARDSSSESP